MLNNQTQTKMEISSKNQVVNAVLGQLNGRIEEMVAKIVAFENKKAAEKNGRMMSEYAIECVRISLVYDLVKSIEKYTLITDELKAIQNAFVSGSIEIYATIIRDGIEYSFVTNVIEAGGYNVQCFHYRYITKTNLPKTGNSELTDSINSEIKRLSKIEKLEEEIKRFENTINHYQSEVNKLELITIEEIKSKDTWYNKTWSDMVKIGSSQYFKGEEDFETKKIESIEKTIKHHNWSIQWQKRCVKDYTKSI
jgi:hypothetical protein